MRSTRAQRDSINLALLIDLYLLRKAQEVVKRLKDDCAYKTAILEYIETEEFQAEVAEQAKQDAASAQRIDDNTPQEKSDKTDSGYEMPGLEINLPIGVTWITEETEVILCKLHLLRDNNPELFEKSFPGAPTANGTSLMPLALYISGQANTHSDASQHDKVPYDPGFFARRAHALGGDSANTYRSTPNMIAWLLNPLQVEPYNLRQVDTNNSRQDPERPHSRL